MDQAQDKIKLEEIINLMTGEWRMYCHNEDTGAFSYALVITNLAIDPVNPYRFTWDGKSHVEGRYTVENGTAEWDPETNKVVLTFTEIWHEADSRDDLQAVLKRNGKFQCVSKKGFTQKARKEDTMPKDVAARSIDPYRKYYAGCCTHAKQADNYVIQLEEISELLTGEWRVYCKPVHDVGFSYGLIITDVQADDSDPHKINWKGESRAEGKYSCEEATAVWNPDTNQVQLGFTEIWHANDSRDVLSARLKNNGKFTCQSEQGFIQKARKEDTMPGSAAQRSSGAYAKYYIGDTAALLEDDPNACIGCAQPVVYHDADDVFWTGAQPQLVKSIY